MVAVTVVHVSGQPAPLAAAAAALEHAFRGVRVKPGKGVEHAHAVAEALRAAGCQELIQVVGLLHDVVEDTPWTPARVRRRFGKRVAVLVAALTEDAGIADYRMRKRALRTQIVRAGPDAIDVALADKVATLTYALSNDKRVPKRKFAHYQALLQAGGGEAAHAVLAARVGELLTLVADRRPD
jgi:(p)ppGpp synthase/HD superfamily hydrolase